LSTEKQCFSFKFFIFSAPRTLQLEVAAPFPPSPSRAPDGGAFVQFCIIIIIIINVSVIYFVRRNSPAETVYKNTFHYEAVPSLYDVDFCSAPHHRYGHSFV
jgi:hypothetical protein